MIGFIGRRKRRARVVREGSGWTPGGYRAPDVRAGSPPIKPDVPLDQTTAPIDWGGDPPPKGKP